MSATAYALGTIGDCPGGLRSDGGTARFEVLDAAARCFAERGFAATSIDDVARRLGSTKGRVYHHFASKMDLFLAVYRRGMELNFAAIEGCGTLREMALAHARAMMREQPYERVLSEGVLMHQHGDPASPEAAALRDLMRLRDAYEARFRDAIGDVFGDRHIATRSFLAVLNSSVLWYQPRAMDTQAEQDAIANQLVETALAGLRGRTT